MDSYWREPIKFYWCDDLSASMPISLVYNKEQSPFNLGVVWVVHHVSS